MFNVCYYYILIYHKYFFTNNSAPLYEWFSADSGVKNHLTELHCDVCFVNSRKGCYPGYLLLAFGTVGWITVVVALGTINGAFLFKEAPLVQDPFTLTASKLLWVPGTTECHHIASPTSHKHTIHTILQQKPFAFKWKGRLGLALISVQK